MIVTYKGKKNFFHGVTFLGVAADSRAGDEGGLVAAR